MNIFYNYELDDDLLIKIDKKALIYLNELKEFVRGRLKVLESEINKEESLGTKMTILILPTNMDKEQGILYSGYSKKLRDKMNSCICVDDIKYIQARLSDLLNRLN